VVWYEWVRVHVRKCSCLLCNILLLVFQNKLLEEEEDEKREEEERRERRKLKEKEKKLRRKEKLKSKEKGNKVNSKTTESDSNGCLDEPLLGENTIAQHSFFLVFLYLPTWIGTSGPDLE
jgi:hypothetical protein